MINVYHEVEINFWSDDVRHVYETIGETTRCINRGGSPQDKVFVENVKKTLQATGYTLFTKPGSNTLIYRRTNAPSTQ